MKTNFTPGPWVNGWYDATENFKQRIAENRQAAIVQHTDGDMTTEGMLIAVCGEFSDPQSIADSVLMAAAPELLKNLELAVTIIKAAINTGAIKNAEKALAEMQSAISKAVLP